MRNETIIQDYLLEKGCKAHTKGFLYLTQAIMQYKTGMFIVSGLYSLIAESNDTTTTRVERDIRNAIKGTCGIKATNSEFISQSALMVDRIEKKGGVSNE